jgi:tripartite-type tricarboxylate transporter receptor subunit TctC
MKMLYYLRNALCIFFTVSFFHISVLASTQDFPNQPIRLIVGFGEGGSCDRLAHIMAPFLEETLKVPVEIINKQGEGTKIAASYVLEQPADGYTLFVTTFTPYLAHTILSKDAPYKIEDFDYINIQWFDNDIIAVNHESPYHSLSEILMLMKSGEKKIKIAVMEDSNGHLLLQLLLNQYNISAQNIELHLFNNGKLAREAITKKKVDLILVSSEGSEPIREYLRALAVFSNERLVQWDIPTVNEAISPLGFQVPVFYGSMRGFAVSAQLKRDYPERYALLIQSFIKVLGKKEVQRILRTEKIGGAWTGPKKSNEIMQKTFSSYQENAYLLRK